MLIEVRNLRIAFRFGNRVSVPVRDVSFDVPENSRVAIVGESGCGKSLTALSLGGLVDRADISGEIDGHARISYVFQNPMQSLNPTMRAGVQIAEANRRGKADVPALLESVGLPRDCERKYPCEMSGGQQQRVMIAMALAAEPDLLVADEPTTALDVTTQAQVLKLMKGLLAANSGLLLITHDLGVVANMATKLAVMKDGRVVETADDVAGFFRAPVHPYSRALVREAKRMELAA